MKLAVAREITPGERRVAVTPSGVRNLVRRGVEVSVEAGAGAGSFFADADYEAAGAKVVADAAALFAGADVIVKLHPPTLDATGERCELDLLGGKVLIALLAPLTSPDLVRALAGANVTSFALDTVPRITRAQSMDVLSSQSTVAGYRAVIVAVETLSKMTPMLMTAAGTVKPASALIIGAGVAGLQAIATAKRLGCVVTAIDVRPAVQEQVESLGARFVPMEVDHTAEDAGGYATDLGADFYANEQEIIAPHTARAHLTITTALIPGRPAPVLITEEMVEAMAPGSVIVDLAAAAGGNCTLSKPGETVTHSDVIIRAPLNLPSEVPVDASEMFSSNVASFLGELLDDDGKWTIDPDNEVIRGTLITRDGSVVHEATNAALEQTKG